MLSKDQVKVAQQHVSQISVPSYLDFNPSQLFTNLSQLKSHDWKQACQAKVANLIIQHACICIRSYTYIHLISPTTV